MRLTERDKRVLRWMNGFGGTTLSQLACFMECDFSTATRRARILRDSGLLARHPLPLSTQGVFSPTKKACIAIGDFLSPITGVRIATVHHDLLLVDAAAALEVRFNCRFETERRLRQRRFSVSTHMPDGLLHFQNNLPIAIELELSCKSISRLDAILNAYETNLEIAGVWYIVIDDSVEAHLRRVASNRPGVKIRRWVRSASSEVEATNV